MHTTLILPTVHRNGTSQEALFDQCCATGRAIREAMDRLCEGAPNERDYYVSPGTWEQAQAQYERRAGTLRALYMELADEAEAISNMGT